MALNEKQVDHVHASNNEEHRRSSINYAMGAPTELPADSPVSESEPDTLVGPNGEQYPTTEERRTLRRVYGKIPWTAYTIAFVELCERFSYYGTTVVFVNFIQSPLPDGSTTGAIVGGSGQPGALGLGQRASTALTLFNSFWAYVMPMVGAWVADTYLGRYLTIQIAIGIAIVGHVLLVVSSTPVMIQNPNGAVGLFAVGIIIMGIGAGGFKSNISPLIAEQYEAKNPRQVIRVEKNGERVIVDPALTIARIYMYFYLMINVGALIGQIAMVFAERFVGFWLAFTLPTLMFLLAPAVLLGCKKRYHLQPPTGSVLSKALHLIWFGIKQSRKKDAPKGDFWGRCKPSRLSSKPKWMTFDDQWVDEVRRGIVACKVFLWFPIWWLAYSQMLNNLVSQAVTLERNGVPNDIVNNIDPLALIIFIPIFDQFVYPFLARKGISFTPIKKILAGFICGTASMVVAAIIQYYIYQQSPCGYSANDCAAGPAPISVWVQIPAYVLIAFSEIFASITGLEYAFTKAPKNMRSIVTSLFLFTSAVSSAISQAFVGLSSDPLLIWLYTTVAILSFLGGIGFWFANRASDKEEDDMNQLPESSYKGRTKSEAARVESGEKK